MIVLNEIFVHFLSYSFDKVRKQQFNRSVVHPFVSAVPIKTIKKQTGFFFFISSIYVDSRLQEDYRRFRVSLFASLQKSQSSVKSVVLRNVESRIFQKDAGDVSQSAFACVLQMTSNLVFFNLIESITHD